MLKFSGLISSLRAVQLLIVSRKVGTAVDVSLGLLYTTHKAVKSRAPTSISMYPLPEQRSMRDYQSHLSQSHKEGVAKTSGHRYISS